MRRREFIATIGTALAAWPPAVRAQQPTLPVIGFLGSKPLAAYAGRLPAFRKGLSEKGYVEGRNVAIEYRWADGQYDRLAALADDLVEHRVSMIVAQGATPAALAAKAATSTIPIIFENGSDPVKAGLVPSLSRPDGNITGVTSLAVQLAAKRLKILHEIVPTATTVCALVNPTNPKVADTVSKDIEAAALSLGVQVRLLRASSEKDIDGAFAESVQLHAGGLVIGPFAFFTSYIEQLAALTIRHAMPAVFQSREFVAAGGLVGYGTNFAEMQRLLGNYAGRILNGEKPADLPVMQVTALELFINLKTAKALGITFPLPLLAAPTM